MVSTALQTLVVVIVIGIIAGLVVNRYGRGWFGTRASDLTAALIGIAGAFIGFHLGTAVGLVPFPLADYLAALGPHEITPMGSSLKICLIAEGAADLYPRLGPTSEWDTAAAQAILESAGGRMMDLVGRPLRYNTKDDLLNPHFLAFGDTRRDWLVPLRQTRGPENRN